MAVVIRMPALAAGATEAAIQTWLVAVGDRVAKGQPIAEIETEKAVVEYEAEDDGVLADILVSEGASAEVGSPIAVLAGSGESADDAKASAHASAAPEPTVPPTPQEAPPTESSEDGLLAAPAPVVELAEAPSESGAAPARRLFASPLVRRLAKERNIDLSGVTGSGPHGRIVRRDLDAVAVPADATASSDAPPAVPAATAPPVPAEPRSAPQDASFEDVPHTGMRRAIARRLTESVTTVPHFFLVAECEVDELLALRARINEQHEVKISVNDFVLKAVAWALRDVPDANAIWTDDAVRRFTGVDIAIAVAVPAGLVTPVIRGVERMTIGELSSESRRLAERAREGRLKQHELEGGSFSVSNLGMYGTKQFSAIINPPHSGILAVGAAERRAVVRDDEIRAATMMTVTLSADHRVVDGALAAEWLAAFVRRIENPLGLLV